MKYYRKRGGTAFPYAKGLDDSDPHYFDDPGMTMRDYFAGQALAGLCAMPSDLPLVHMVQKSYRLADLMLTQREIDDDK